MDTFLILPIYFVRNAIQIVYLVHIKIRQNVLDVFSMLLLIQYQMCANVMKDFIMFQDKLSLIVLLAIPVAKPVMEDAQHHVLLAILMRV